jgi:hypothetical protein
MTRSFSKHDFVAIIALLAWAAAIVVMIVNPDTRRWIPPILLCSVATLFGAVMLSRYWIRRASVPSFGSLAVVPFACALLFMFGTLLWEVVRYDSWYLLTPDYWQQTKRGWATLYLPLGVLAGICVFPAAVVVVYYQKRKKTDA